MTFKELCKKYNWTVTNCPMTTEQQILYAASHGVQIEKRGKGRINDYIITNNPEEWFTRAQLRERYNWKNNATKDFIKYCKDRGVIVEQVGISKSPIYYKIIEEIKTEWVTNLKYPNIEISPLGLIRSKSSKRILKSKNTQGYCVYTNQQKNNKKSVVVQRIIMETFNPVDNMENLYVDHINGIRDDNRLENLRWVTHKDNMIYRQENWKLLQNNFEKALQKFGYEELNKKLEKLLIDN